MSDLKPDSGQKSVDIDSLQARGRYLCSLCGVGHMRNYLRKAAWDYVRCDKCGAVSLSTLPSDEDLEAYYNETYMVPLTAYARGATKKAPGFIRELIAERPAKGKLLEVGCSYGYFLDHARRSGWHTTGIELDNNAATHGRDKLELNIHCGTLASEFGNLEPPYDVIVTFHVIEHIPDPIGFLKLCAQLLCENGMLMLATPNAASWIATRTGAYWQWLCPPAHIHLFSVNSLKQALERCGFQIEKIRSQRGDAHNNMFELACATARLITSRKQDKSTDRGRKTWSDKWEVNLASAVSEAIYYPIGLLTDKWLANNGLQPELVAIARKT